jgi:hypothetical protein
LFTNFSWCVGEEKNTHLVQVNNKKDNLKFIFKKVHISLNFGKVIPFGNFAMMDLLFLFAFVFL